MAIENLAPVGARPLLPAPVALPAADNGPTPAIANDRLALSPVANKLMLAAPSYAVKPGDTLSAIARDQLGDGNRWPEIFELNQNQIEDPNLIYPGQVLQLPNKPVMPAPAPAVMPPVPAPYHPPVGCFPAKPVQLPRPAFPVMPMPMPAPPPKPQRPDLLAQKQELQRIAQQVSALEASLDRLLARLDDQPVYDRHPHQGCRQRAQY
jgi:LysM repeat protein